MHGQQNSVIRQQLIREIKQLESREQMINYYMSYDFPEKQRSVKGWWEDLIESVIKKKNQIFVTFKDLQNIAHIHGVKPVPLKAILNLLKKDYVFVREEDLTQQKKPQKKVKPWYTNIINFSWAGNNKEDEPDFPFTFNPQEKIVSIATKQRKKRQLFGFLYKQFEHENSKFMRRLLKQLSWFLKIDQISVQILLKQLRAQKQLEIKFDENFGDNIVIFNADRKKIMDENFINIEKIKCSLKGSLQRFDTAYEKSSAKIANLRQRAKDAARNSDKNKARVIVAQMKKQEDHREKIQIQKQVLEQKVSQIQVNQMNKSSLELLSEAQSAYQQVAVDQQRFDQVIQKARQIQMESDQVNKKFQQLAASEQIQDQVDHMMKEIEMEMHQEKIVEPKIVEPKTVNVVLGDKQQNQKKSSMNDVLKRYSKIVDKCIQNFHIEPNKRQIKKDEVINQ